MEEENRGTASLIFAWKMSAKAEMVVVGIEQVGYTALAAWMEKCIQLDFYVSANRSNECLSLLTIAQFVNLCG